MREPTLQRCLPAGTGVDMTSRRRVLLTSSRPSISKESNDLTVRTGGAEYGEPRIQGFLDLPDRDGPEGQVVPPEERAFEPIKIRPTDGDTLEFEGRLLSHKRTPKPYERSFFAQRWYDFYVYATSDDKFVLRISYDSIMKWKGEDEKPHTAVFMCNTKLEIAEHLRSYPLMKHVRIDYVPQGHICFVEDTERHVRELKATWRHVVQELLQDIGSA
jgi:hypothetical protein